MRTRTKWIWRLAWVPAVLLLPFLLFFAFEAVYLGLWASEEFIDNYHFGSEAMLFHGGWAYRSVQTYVGSLAVNAVLLCFAIAAFGVAAWRHSVKSLAAGVVLTALVVAATVWARDIGV